VPQPEKMCETGVNLLVYYLKKVLPMTE